MPPCSGLVGTEWQVIATGCHALGRDASMTTQHPRIRPPTSNESKVTDMATDIDIKNCPACGESTDTLTKRVWTHNDPYETSEWAYEDGEAVRGVYCPECIKDIDNLNAKYEKYISEYKEMDEDAWKHLAIKLARGYSRVATNWKDGLTYSEKNALKSAGIVH